MPDPDGTVAGALATARARLGAAGIAEPAREAARMWADLNGAPPGGLLLHSRRPVDPAAAARLMTLVERRAEGEPLPYVTGCAGFRRLDLKIDARALIPRPETEGLVDVILERAPVGRIADVGTGSGCIALSLATEGRYDLVLGIDTSADALGLAAANCELVGAGVNLVQGDLTTGLAPSSLDAIVANPPYLTDAEHAALEPAVARYEPREALVSGVDGLDATVRLLNDARRVVRAGGWLVVEVDTSRASSVAALAWGMGWEAVEMRVDLFGRERYLLARRSEAP